MSGSPIKTSPSGFLLIDKEQGYTSHDVVAKLRGITGVKTIGHGGTLDPLATGLLIVGIGKAATRELSSFLGAPKTYEATIALGHVSETYDVEGPLTPASDAKPTLPEVQTALEGFTGEILQTPPVFSALKVKGKKAYELARSGKAPELKARPVTIYELKLQAYTYPTIELTVRSSGGTYIRSLAHDLGRELGVGGYLSGLRRTEIGDLSIDKSSLIESINRNNWTQKLFNISDAKMS